jgi:hypothetical protein
VKLACVEIPLGRQKLKVLSLERILVSKIVANRAKDKLTIPVLRDALRPIHSRPSRAPLDTTLPPSSAISTSWQRSLKSF